MRTIACWLLTTMTILSACQRMPIQKNEQDLIAMELNRSKAIASHDSITLDKMYATEFKGVTATGFEVDKPTLMQVFKRDNPNTIFINDNHKARLIDKKTAILTGKLTAKDKSGKILAQSLFVHVLIWRDGRWQILHGQGTILPLNN